MFRIIKSSGYRKPWCPDCERSYNRGYRRRRKELDLESVKEYMVETVVLDPWYDEEWSRRYERNLAALLMMGGRNEI
jgi:UDP-N-acetylglucosamine pyrophosphorylase